MRQWATQRQPTITGWIVAVSWFAADQGTKWWIIEQVMDPPRVIVVTSFFNLVLVWNRGVSYGMLSGAVAPWLLAVLAVLVSGLLLVWLKRIRSRVASVALGLLVGGALSNALDRLHHGGVTDFLDFHVGGWHWPSFNLADAGIVCGTAAMVLHSFTTERADRSASRRWT